MVFISFSHADNVNMANQNAAESSIFDTQLKKELNALSRGAVCDAAIEKSIHAAKPGENEMPAGNQINPDNNAAPDNSEESKDSSSPENAQGKNELILKTNDAEDNNAAGSAANDPSAQTGQSSASEPQKEETKKRGKAFDIKAETMIEGQKDGKTFEIHKGETCVLIVRISWEGDPYSIIAEPPETFPLEGLSIENIAPVFKSSPETNRASAEFHYTLKATEPGKGVIGPVAIPFVFNDSSEKNQLKTSSLSLQILPPRKNWFKIIGLPLASILVIVSATIAVIKILTARKEARLAKLNAPKEPTPLERLLSELDAQKLVLIEGDMKTFYDNCFKLIRGFISLSHNGHTTKMTAMELMDYLEANEQNSDLRDKTLNLLNKCEGIRFGGYFPSPAENEQMIKDIHELLTGATAVNSEKI